MADTAKVFNMPLAMMCGIEAEKEISRDGSHYSLSTGILPSLGARSNHRVKFRRFIVSPYDRRYRTTYLLVDDPKLIAWKYLTSWFVLDVASTIPSELARKLLPNKLRSYGFFNMLRLWRLKRVSALFARTDSEGLQQQETLDALPKAIRSSITHYLFYSLVQSVYLFHGVSNDLLFQLVSKMKAEYYPPREDVILQNEAPTDFYILVTGTAVETRTLEELEELLEFSCQNRTSLTRIMLDNMVVPLPNGDVDVSMLKDAVQLVNGRFETEFTNLKYSRVEIDEVRFEWAECMLD
ncbi:hypothetical protein ZIOFF_065306 [Zingiber officinale]|uniref:Cyclic nucleotide-binding domain-containing protein n=1 Tax=Zingiber officinale TaxID=94328 RepID=A0A8J5KBE5_ZINOF|nr:hypothetical protein ZIOFF_065306 [Zingiber officinale]